MCGFRSTFPVHLALRWAGPGHLSFSLTRISFQWDPGAVCFHVTQMSPPLRRESGFVEWAVMTTHLRLCSVHQSNTSDNLWSLWSKPTENPLNKSVEGSDAVTKICSIVNSREAGALGRRKESCMMQCFYCLAFPSGWHYSFLCCFFPWLATDSDLTLAWPLVKVKWQLSTRREITPAFKAPWEMEGGAFSYPKVDRSAAD